MGIEGLDFILNKREVIYTVSASDLIHRAEQVDSDYRRHVRTYVPINRAAEGRDDTLSVVEFERRVIKAVKDARAPRGYLTAEYGYGKTSTALYLWDRAENENLVVVPPFQMIQLQDLITATHGWVRYRLSISHPALVPQLDQIYLDTTSRSLEHEASVKGIPLSVLQEYVAQGRFVMELQANDYITYFEKVTDIVLQAGYDGLLVLPDEIQQYIEPRMQRSDDPITPLFLLVQAFGTRERYMRCGLVMVIPQKEIAVIREARGRDDLLHRMRELSLDLTSIYDHDFALRLWNQLADECGFRDIAHEIVTPEALEALGEVASRDDLSNGPRTVINTFRRMVERYKTHASRVDPYTPIDFVDDLLGGAIQFTGNNQIQTVTRRALQNAIIRTDPDFYEKAIKLAAAYPGAGVPLRIQQKYGVQAALDQLMQQALGELVIAIGPIDQHGVTLYGLQVGQINEGWLKQTIRDFRRAFGTHHDETRRRALVVFAELLKKKVFTGWTLIAEREANFTSNFSLIFEGDFQSFKTQFPQRRVHVRIFWEDEELKDADTDGDVAIHYGLTLRRDLEDQPQARSSAAQAAWLDYDTFTANIPLNLVYVRPEGLPPQIQQELQSVWSPYELSPLVLMNIYQMLEQKRADNLIPRDEDQYIMSGFQPDLLETVMRDLFNAEVGGGELGGIQQARITEQAIKRLLEARYGDTYHTLIAANNWRSTLQRYTGALDKLPNPYQKRGEVEYEGTKDEVANLMTYSNPAFDNFVKNYPDMITITRKPEGRDSTMAVRFTLHDLEKKIMHWLRESKRLDHVKLGNKTVEVRIINTADVYKNARVLGYQDAEVEEVIKLLVKRVMLETYQQYQLREVPSQTVDLDGLAFQLDGFFDELKLLQQGFPDNNQLATVTEDADKWQQAIDKERQSGAPDPQRVHRLSQTIRVRQGDLRTFALDRQRELFKQASILRQGLRPIGQQYMDVLNTPIVGAVSYVDQVNALRRAVQVSANAMKADIDRLNARLGKILEDLKPETLSYETLSRCANDLSQMGGQADKARQQYEDFEQSYQHLTAWRGLVDDGSTLLDELQQMGRITTQHMIEFERLSNEISGRISSAANKLHILPDHSIFTSRLSNIRQQVRNIRQEAESAFVDLQNRFYQRLTDQGLFKRDQMGRTLVYNLSDPEESYRSLYEKVQSLLLSLIERMVNVVRLQQQDVQNTLNTPLLVQLAEDDRYRISSNGQSLVDEAAQLLQALHEIRQVSEDIHHIQDDQQTFPSMIEHLVAVRDRMAGMQKRTQTISEWLTRFDLSPLEQILLDGFPDETGDRLLDLVELRNCRPDLSPDEFWEALRGLYEKRRVRLSVGSVRG